MYKAKDVIAAMDRIAPPALALPGDPIGLHAGDPGANVGKVAVALDASLPVLKKAAAAKAAMLVVHHPRFYRGLATLAESDPSGRRASEIARLRLAVYSAHTNLDNAPGGVNDVLAETVGLKEPSLVKPEVYERLLKLAVFVPATHIEKVRKALCDAGAGGIGKYSECTFRVRGVGTFLGGGDAKPFLGKPGVLEEADEFRLETVFGEFAAGPILDAMLAAHPYEEVAYDLYPLLGWAGQFGLGRVGNLDKVETLSAFAKRLAKATRSRMTQFMGRPTAKIRRVATWAGGGVDVRSILACRPDALVAGEASYHDLETFADNGVNVVTLGHGHSEEIVLRPVAKRLRRELPGLPIAVIGDSGPLVANVE